MPITSTETHVILTHPDDESTELQILKYGATVVSWKIHGEEQLWLLEGAKLDGLRPVRGGVPLVFPVFGKSSKAGFDQLPQHGFARNSEWDFLGVTSSDPPTVQLALSPEEANPDIYQKWGGEKEENYNFLVFVTVELGAQSMKMSVEVQNREPERVFNFNWLFHTYLRVPDIEDTLVTNLPGEKCYDQLLKESYEEKAPAVQFHQETDRIYINVDTKKDLQVVHLGKAIHTIKRDNLPDVVVWNPWIEKSKGMGDFEPKDGYKHMVCVEAGKVGEFVELGPMGIWKASQELKGGEDIKLHAV